MPLITLNHGSIQAQLVKRFQMFNFWSLVILFNYLKRWARIYIGTWKNACEFRKFYICWNNRMCSWINRNFVDLSTCSVILTENSIEPMKICCRLISMAPVVDSTNFISKCMNLQNFVHFSRKYYKYVEYEKYHVL